MTPRFYARLSPNHGRGKLPNLAKEAICPESEHDLAEIETTSATRNSRWMRQDRQIVSRSTGSEVNPPSATLLSDAKRRTAGR